MSVAMREDCAWAVERGEEYHSCLGWGCERTGCYRKKQAAQRRKAELAGYRKFSGNDFQQARRARINAAVETLGPAPPYTRDPDGPWETWIAKRREVTEPLHLARGHCSWCEGEIYKPGIPVLNLRRGWHDGRGDEPNCLLTYYQHTRHPEQLDLILDRDGTRCASCGEDMGRWYAWHSFTPDRIKAWGDDWLTRFPPDIYAGDFTAVRLAARLEVDHRLALGLVVLTIDPAERWRWFGPQNLQGLCRACHNSKTKEDVRLIKAARKENASVAV